MSIVIYFLILLFLLALVSERLERSVITVPMILTIAGILFAFFVQPAFDPGMDFVLLLAEIALVLILFTEATRIDLRTLVPLDEEAILRSVAKTGRLVVVDEDYERCGFSAEVSAVVAEKGFHNLKAPVARVANPNVPLPFNKKLEQHVLPDVDKIVRAIKGVVK